MGQFYARGQAKVDRRTAGPCRGSSRVGRRRSTGAQFTKTRLSSANRFGCATLPPNGADSSKHSVSIRSNNDDLACTEVHAPSCKPGIVTVPILVRQERNFRMQRQGRENHDQRRRKPEETKTGQDRSRKSPQKWPTWTQLAKPWFGRTGWWRMQSSETRLPVICRISA
jgi:hypothetical protein